MSSLDAAPSAQDVYLKFIHSAMYVLRAARRRKRVIIASLIITGMLGAIFYSSAERIYKSSAQLLIIPHGSDTTPDGVVADARSQDLMPTLQKLITSAVVLNDTLSRLDKMPPEARVDFQGILHEERQKKLLKNLSTNSLNRTNIIEISYRSKSPEAASAVVNTVIASYIDFINRHHQDVSAEIVTALNEDLYELEARRQEKEQELKDLRTRVSDLGLPPESVHPELKEVLTLGEKVVEIQKERVSLEASLSAVRSAVDRGADMRQHLLDLQPMVGREVILGALGMTEEDTRSISNIETEIGENRAQLRVLSEHLGPAHPEIRQIQEAIHTGERYLAEFHERVELRISGASSNSLGSMLITMLQEELAKVWEHENLQRAEYELAHARAVDLNNELGELTIVKHDLELLDRWYDVLVTRVSEIHISDNRADIQIAVTSEPTINESPVSPRLSIVILITLLFGLVSGGSIVFVLDVIDDQFRTPEDIQDQLGVPLLSMIRKMEPNNNKGIEGVQMFIDSKSVEAEAFRTLRTTLAFSEKECTRLVVSSSEPGDGKTTTLANMGVAFANAGKRTLLIDADMRRPGLTRLFDLKGEAGLSDILRSSDPIEENAPSSILGTGAENLDIIPCGMRTSDPSELLSGERFQYLISWAESIYDQILIDTPPILAASDAAIVGRVTDGVMVVVQPDKNNRRAVVRSVNSLTSIGIPVIGVVANVISTDSKGYYGTGYGYGFGYGYADYGSDEEEVGDFQPNAPAETPRSIPSVAEDDAASKFTAKKGLTVPRRAA